MSRRWFTASKIGPHANALPKRGEIRVVEIDRWPDDMKDDLWAPYMNDEGFMLEAIAFESDRELIAAVAIALTSPDASSVDEVRLAHTRDPMSGLRKSWCYRMAARRRALVDAIARVSRHGWRSPDISVVTRRRR